MSAVMAGGMTVPLVRWLVWSYTDSEPLGLLWILAVPIVSAVVAAFVGFVLGSTRSVARPTMRRALLLAVMGFAVAVAATAVLGPGGMFGVLAWGIGCAFGVDYSLAIRSPRAVKVTRLVTVGMAMAGAAIGIIWFVRTSW
ncbi:MAG TPA: hypothetical protein VM221_00450 [Armatimonadota bacterium]|nr:hypothetical protein [Armatimonadota bacterium]